MSVCDQCGLDIKEYPRHKNIHLFCEHNNTIFFEDSVHGYVCSVCLLPKREIKKNRKKKKHSFEIITELEKEYKRECRSCKSIKNLTVDHIIPAAKGGQSIMKNYQILCRDCNNLKADLLPGKNGWWPDELMEYLK